MARSAIKSANALCSWHRVVDFKKNFYEYHTPIHEGYIHGYYKDVIDFFRSFLSEAFKDNKFLKKGVLTGILRVARESIFSGLNNLGVYSLIKSEYDKCFGLTEDEMQDALKYFNLEHLESKFQEWYNGYQFGKEVIYNPWSILNVIKRKKCKMKFGKLFPHPAARRCRPFIAFIAAERQTTFIAPDYYAGAQSEASDRCNLF